MLREIKINGTQLKLIAIITMLIDHIGAVLIEQSEQLYIQFGAANMILRGIGRIAFPIFCYLSVQGFIYTRNIKRYVIRLFLFAVISEIPFDLALFDTFFHMGYNNVIWSILIGVLMLVVIRKYECNHFVTMFAMLGACMFGTLLKTDYLFFAPLLMGVLYKLRFQKRLQVIAGMILTIYLYHQNDLIWLAMVMFSFALFLFYDNTKGRGWKYFFYVFYPAHLLILYVIRKVMLG